MQLRSQLTSPKRLRSLGLLMALALIATVLSAASLTAAPIANAATSTGGLFNPLQQRLYDSRGTDYAGNTAKPLTAGKWYPVKVAGVGTAPRSGMSAVQVTLTEVDGAPNGTLKADATGVATPNTSVPSLLWSQGRESNAATIPVGTDGNFQIYVTTATDIVIDLQGYYTSGSTAAGGYVPGLNEKILGSSSTKYTKSTPLTLQVSGTDQVPSNASAVMLSVLVTPAEDTTGFMRIYPSGESSTSSVNWDQGERSVFTSAIKLNASGKVTFAVQSGTVSLQVAVQGYFTPVAAGSTAGAFTPVRARPFDTRSETPLAPDETRTFQVSGADGLPELSGGIAAIAGNLVIYPGSSASTGQGSVLVSAEDSAENFWTQFFYPGEKVSGFSVTALGVDGSVSVHNSSKGSIDVLMDVEGWYSGLSAATVTCPGSATNGSWNATPPQAAFACQVTAPAAPSGEGSIDITVDGISLVPVALKTTAAVSTPITIPAGAGQHSVQTVVHANAFGPTRDSEFTFGFGNWSDQLLTPSTPDEGKSLGLTPSLWATTVGAPFTDDTVARYLLSEHADGSAPIATTDYSAEPMEIAAGTLSLGVKYYWKAEVKGPRNSDGVDASISSPWWSFIASDMPTTANFTAATSASGSTPQSDEPDSTQTPQSTTTKRCYVVTVIFVRGTFEGAGKGTSSTGYAYKSGGYGGPGDKLYTQMKNDTQIPVYAEGLKYPATVMNIKRLGKKPYLDSVNVGVQALQLEINNIAASCPYTNIMLSGHSQGAHVISKALSSPGSDLLTKAAKSHLSAIALTGNPTYYDAEAINASGNGDNSGKAFLLRKKGSLDGYKNQTAAGTINSVRSYCFGNDLFCQLTGVSMDVHNSYATVKTAKRQWAFMKPFLIDIS